MESPPPPGGRQEHPAPGTARAYLSVGCVLASVLAWRNGVLFTGSVDPVVLAKAALAVVGLGLAVGGARGGPARVGALGAVVGALLALYLGISLVGAAAAGTLAATAVLVVRVLILFATVLALALRMPGEQLLTVFAHTAIGAALLTGLTGLATDGLDPRLGGGIPPVAPNELALLAAVGTLHLTWRALRRGLSPWGWIGLGTLLAMLLLTQSRTSVLMLAVGIAVLLLRPGRLRPGVVVTGALLVPAALWVLLLTDLPGEYVGRGGRDSLSTFNSRTLAWDAALNDPPSLFAQWFGQGLSTKLVPVDGRFWTTQVLDSSWVSAIVQAGWLGTGVVLVLTALVTVRVLVAPTATRGLQAAVLTFLLGRSVLESHLFDASAAFLLFLAVVLADDAPTTPTRPLGEPHARHRAPAR